MIVKNEQPPKHVWDSVTAAFKVPEKVFFTYGDIIYVVGDAKLTPDTIRHEETHRDQQAHIEGGPDEWWHRFVVDKEFRLDQESEAYAAQYRFLCQNNKDKNKQFAYLRALGTMLSSPIYGSMISKGEAMNLIRQLSTLDKVRGDE